MSIAGYVIVYTAQEMDKKTSELIKLFCERYLINSMDYTPLGQVFGFYIEVVFVDSNDCKDAGGRVMQEQLPRR